MAVPVDRPSSSAPFAFSALADDAGTDGELAEVDRVVELDRAALYAALDWAAGRRDASDADARVFERIVGLMDFDRRMTR